MSTAEPPRDFRAHDFAGDDGRDEPSQRLSDDLLPSRAYPSNLLWRMTRALESATPPARILDLGPTSNANIQFWAGRGFDVTCYDLFGREARRLGQLDVTPLTLAADAVRQQKLPHETASFSAVMCWNVLGRLPFVLAQQFARECHRVLAPAGLLHAIFLDADGRLDTRRQYELVDRQQLRVTSVAVPRRLPNAWIDAEIRLMLSRFGACEIQGAASHTREVLAQHDAMALPR